MSEGLSAGARHPCQPSWDHHCSDVAAAHVLAATGRDIWAELGGAPRSPKEAAALMKRLKVRTLKNLVSKVMGKPVDPRQAMRGDLVLVEGRPVNALGICRGEWVECMDKMLPIGRAICCWRVRQD